MAEGDFEAAWQASDDVLAARDPAGADDPAQPCHLRWVWDGRPLEGRRVLVRCYHGLGDTLQFARYLAPLRARAAHVTLEAQPPLLPLLHRIGGADRLVPFDPAAPLPPDECNIEIMELAHALRLPPTPAPYLVIEPQARRQERLQVGLCWQAGATWDRDRGIADNPVGLLERVPGVTLHSLQPGAAIAGTDCPDTIADTAQLVAALDLVVSVDTMVAHLAGSIGTPVWLLLKSSPDWRWLAGGDGSPWYGGIRKFRQARPGEWGPPLAALANALEQRAASGTLAATIGL